MMHEKASCAQSTRKSSFVKSLICIWGKCKCLTNLKMRTRLFCHIGTERHSVMRVSAVLKSFLLLVPRGARAALHPSAPLAQAKPDPSLLLHHWQCAWRGGWNSIFKIYSPYGCAGCLQQAEPTLPTFPSWGHSGSQLTSSEENTAGKCLQASFRLYNTSTETFQKGRYLEAYPCLSFFTPWAFFFIFNFDLVLWVALR